MGVVNFGVTNSNTGILSRLKPYPTPNIQGVVPAGGIPVVRAGNKNYFLPTKTSTISDGNYATEISLYSSNPNVLIQATDFTSVTAGAKMIGLWLSSSDQAMFVLFKGTDGLIRLSKISDTTGAVTHLGAGFTPTTPAKWGSGPTNSKLEFVGGVLRYSTNGYYHTINKTTGAAVAEDIVFTLAGYANNGPDYLSADGTTYAVGNLSLTPLGANTPDGSLQLPQVSHAAVGIIPYQYIDVKSALGVDYFGYSAAGGLNKILPTILVDDDKVCFTVFLTNSNSPLNMVLRANYDAFLLSLVNWWSGV